MASSNIARLSRKRPTALNGSLAAGLLLAGIATAHAQTYSTTIVAPTQTVVDTFSTTTTPSSPTYNRVAIAAGLNNYTTTTPGLSGIGTAVAYATSPSFVPTATGTYTINTSTSGFDPADYIQYIYQPALATASPTTGVQYGYFADNSTNNGSYNVSLTGATAYQFVNAGYYSTNNTNDPQTPGSGFYSEGTSNTTVLYDNPGSTSAIPDNSTTGASQTITVTNTNAITTFNSITIDGLSHPFIGDLVATLTHTGANGTTTVDLFDHVGANNTPGSPGYNYNQGSSASFDGNNYTFALSGASLAAVPGGTAAPDGVTYMASGNATTGFDTADANNTLNSFLGQSEAGTWTLSIKDEQLDDTGSFTGFSFTVNNAAPEPSQYAAFGLGVLGIGALALRARRRSAA